MAKVLQPVNNFREWRAKVWYKVLVDEDFERLPKAMNKLNRIKHPVTLIACTNLLAHTYPEVRAWAARQIGKKKEYMENEELRSTVYKKIEKLAQSGEYHIRESAVDALGYIDDPVFAVHCMRQMLRYEDDISVMIKIIDVLAEYKTKYSKAETVLREMLKNNRFINYRDDIRHALGLTNGST